MNNSSRPNRLLWVDHFKPLEVWRFPFRLENLLLAIPFILIWSFLLGSYHVGGSIMVVRSALAIYLTLGMFFCYLFVILDFTARGYQTPPKINGDLLNGHKGRFAKGLILTSLFASLAYTFRFSDTLPGLVYLSAAIFLPIAFSIIAIQDNFLNAINPMGWFEFISAINFDGHVGRYLVILALTLLGWQLLLVNLGWFNLGSMCFAVICMILLFRSLGVLLHANAAALGLSVRFGPELEAAQSLENQRRELSDFAQNLYQQAEVGRINEALASYSRKLSEDKFASETMLWEMLREWSNPALAVSAGQGYIERLVKQDKLRESWEVLNFCFKHNNSEYTLLNGNSTLRLTAAASNSAERKISAQLLKYFDKDFPGHPDTATALLQAVELLIVDSDDGAAAKKLLDHIRIKFPDIARTPAFKSLDQMTR